FVYLLYLPSFPTRRSSDLAVFLVIGLLNNLTCVVGIVWSLGIWSIAEGFGGPYQPGQSTDIGTAFVYALMFGVLLAVAAGRYYRSEERRVGKECRFWWWRG